MLLRFTIGMLSLAHASIVAAAPGPTERVDNGLLPAITLIDRPTRKMNLAQRMEHYKVPAISVAVIDNHRIAWAKAYGSLESSSLKAATSGTLFQAGSLSKPISAAAALTLVQKGKLALDEPLNRYLASWKIPATQGIRGSDVTLRRVLSHTAGINVHGFRGYELTEKLPTLIQVLNGSAPANSNPIQVNQTPGQALRYSGGGYVVLQQAVEDVTGQRFDKAVRDVLFRPLRMSDSSFSQTQNMSSNRLAIGHKVAGEELRGGWHRFTEMAPAGLWTTPTDLARFVVWLMEGINENGSPWQQAIAHQMVEPQKDLRGKEIRTPNGNRAGLGLVLEGEGPRFRISHSGTNVGYKAIMVGFPETGQGAVIMANSNTSGDLIKEVLRSVAAEYRWPEQFHEMLRAAPLADSALQTLAGTYKFESREAKGKTMEVLVRPSKGSLRVSLPDGSDREVHPLDNVQFVDPENGMKFLFQDDGVLRIPEYGISAKRN